MPPAFFPSIWKGYNSLCSGKMLDHFLSTCTQILNHVPCCYHRSLSQVSCSASIRISISASNSPPQLHYTLLYLGLLAGSTLPGLLDFHFNIQLKQLWSLVVCLPIKPALCWGWQDLLQVSTNCTWLKADEQILGGSWLCRDTRALFWIIFSPGMPWNKFVFL